MRSSAQTLRPAERSGFRLSARAAQLVLTCVLAGCVTHNVTTGKAVPRAGQKYPFADVEKAAEKLQVGLTKAQTLMLLGSPAEMDASADVWVYLPERYGILVPARALRLAFHDELLAEYGYRPIVLGAQL